MPELLQAESLLPSQKDSIVIRRDPESTRFFLNGSIQGDSTSGVPELWAGKMVVVVDGGTGSSAEPAALLLRHHLGAVVAGSPSYGVIDYGNSTPYYLPMSGLEIRLAAQANDWGVGIDFIGIQPDIPVPAATPLHEIAADFHTLRDAGAATRRR